MNTAGTARVPALVSALVRSAAAVALLGFAGCGGGEPASQTPAAGGTPAAAAPAGGTIRGVVRLRGDAPAPAFQPIEKDHNVCGTQAPVTRLSVGNNGGVRNAFVFLDDAPASGAAQARAATAPVQQSRCEYAPHAMALQTGTKLDISNADPILHNVHARRATPSGLETVFNIAQPVRGQRTVVEPPLTLPGIVTLTCEAGHPWMTAYVLVADHPYTAVTAEDGSFVIGGVPPGTYRLRMWHEGVRLTNVFKSVQQFEYEEPYEETRPVTVAAGREVEVDFDLVLRAARGASAN
jgi:hypothetical protein